MAYMKFCFKEEKETEQLQFITSHQLSWDLNMDLINIEVIDEI